MKIIFAEFAILFYYFFRFHFLHYYSYSMLRITSYDIVAIKQYVSWFLEPKTTYLLYIFVYSCEYITIIVTFLFRFQLYFVSFSFLFLFISFEKCIQFPIFFMRFILKKKMLRKRRMNSFWSMINKFAKFILRILFHSINPVIIIFFMANDHHEHELYHNIRSCFIYTFVHNKIIKGKHFPFIWSWAHTYK